MRPQQEPNVILGQPAFFTRQHYEAHAVAAPAHLCELVVHCLELVSQLSHHGLAYRFKGGNSLLLLLEAPERFSIDVDIVTTTPKEQLVRLVERVAESCDVFGRWEWRQPQTKPWLPMVSFKLFFESVYQSAEDAYVMLDVVLEPPPYPGVLRQVRCGALYASEQQVEVPTVSGLIGDKLLTIGPSTLGIPLGRGKEAQRLKHVFDVALLSRRGYELGAVREAITGCQAQEQRIQGRGYSWEEIASDTARFCSAPLGYAEPPPLGSLSGPSYLSEIVTGFEHFRQHLLRTDYTWSRLQDDCRRVMAVLDALGPRQMS
jgi:hypothetical protein